MTNPPYILEHLPEMAKILSHPRVYSFLHVPVQSGSDSVLADMKREYCQADFRQVADYLKQQVPGVNIATDVICGFPTETEADFSETLRLVSDYKFPSLFINQFFPRPGTPAANMKRIPANEVKERTKLISKLFQSYLPYEHKLGEVQDVLVTEISHDKKYYVGHNKFYDQVLVPMDKNLMGKMVTVEITETGKHFMKCNLVEEGRARRPQDVPAPLPQGQVSGVNRTQVSSDLLPKSQAPGVNTRDIVLTQNGLWFFVAAMVVMFAAVAWRIYGLVVQLIT
ncbi:hypothetical protein DPMN_091318 [Dreissena polymorpha]|uniref:tRNA (N(6)-L-threonylcarbamoyladenosine(37)-C(2))-methylthiotransferase n=2 Tax=Dreissena polymorpha TaxID=45954 RepID=A0A9D4KZB7_DREPO|nr:hypothetical protein DPMN_091318 [Dreissena polymorpha]